MRKIFTLLSFMLICTSSFCASQDAFYDSRILSESETQEENIYIPYHWGFKNLKYKICLVEKTCM